MNGIIIIKKERGYTSHDVVAKLRGILHMKKIGHTGTLDPDAVGVLPVCVGKASKVCSLLTDQDKTYVAEVKLGVTTDTLDLTGKILTESRVDVTEDQVREALERFRGVIPQIPPMYSAIKIKGKKLYELARQGIEVERTPRMVTVHELILRGIAPDKQEFTIEVTCSKGTYIRSLCHDIGQALGCGASMKSLIRTRVGKFGLEQARTLEEIEEAARDGVAERLLIGVDEVFDGYRRCRADTGAMRSLRNGNPIDPSLCSLKDPKADERVRMYGDDGEFYAVCRYDAGEGTYRVVKMFHE